VPARNNLSFQRGWRAIISPSGVACAHQPREKHIVTKKTSCLVILMMFVLLMPLLAMLAHQRNSPIVASAGHHVHLLESPRYRRMFLCCKNTIAKLRRNIVMISSSTKPKSSSALHRRIAPLSRRDRSRHLSKFHCRGCRVVVLALRVIVVSDAFFRRRSRAGHRISINTANPKRHHQKRQQKKTTT